MKSLFKSCIIVTEINLRKWVMNNYLTQMKLLFKRKSFIVTLAVTILYGVFTFLIFCFEFSGKYIIDVPAAKYLYFGSDFGDIFFVIYSLIFPLMAALPFADTFFEESKNSTTEFCITRTSNDTYYFSKLAAVFSSGFLIAAAPLAVNYLLNFVAFPLDSSIDATNFNYVDSYLFADVMETGLFQNLFASNIYLYNLLYLFLASFISGLIAVIVFQFSFFYRKSRILLICSMFVIVNFLIIVMDSLGLMQFDILNYIFASRFYCGQSVIGMIVTFALMISAAFIPIPFAKKRLSDCYE